MGKRLLGLALGLAMMSVGLLAGTAQHVSAGVTVESCFDQWPTIVA